MAQRMSGYQRVADDQYETPVEVTLTIVPHLQHAGVRRPWEPATAPKDGIAVALRRAGFTVVSTSDDFLQYRAAPANVDGIVSNPPYGQGGRLAVRFIEHALSVATRRSPRGDSKSWRKK